METAELIIHSSSALMTTIMGGPGRRRNDSRVARTIFWMIGVAMRVARTMNKTEGEINDAMQVATAATEHSRKSQKSLRNIRHKGWEYGGSIMSRRGQI